VHIEAALNLLWVSLGLAALAITVRCALKRRRAPAASDARTGSSAWLHIVGVSLIVLALFPYISATDDVLRIEQFNAQTSHRHTNNPGKHDRTNNLIRLYETMDAPLVCSVRGISLALLFIALVVLPAPRVIDRIQPQQAGRSPPVVA
jgi:hypothetical protein